MELRSAFYVAQRLGVSRWTVYRLAKRGELDFTRVGRQMRFKDDEVKRYVANHTRPARTH